MIILKIGPSIFDFSFDNGGHKKKRTQVFKIKTTPYNTIIDVRMQFVKCVSAKIYDKLGRQSFTLVAMGELIHNNHII